MVEVTLTATAGDDLINVRLLEYTSLTDIIVNLGNGDDEIRAWDANDQIWGGRGADAIYGGFGDDRIKAGRDNDYVDAGHGNDRVWGNGGDDIIKAGPGDDLINGGNGNDIIYGVKGNNFLRGGGGDDVIYTGIHDSRIQGQKGEDTIHINLISGADHEVSGGDDADTFVFNKLTAERSSFTTITDFEVGLDRFEIEGVSHIMFMATYLSGASAAMLRDGDSGAEILLASRDMIRLEGVTVEELTTYYDTFILA